MVECEQERGGHNRAAMMGKEGVESVEQWERGGGWHVAPHRRLVEGAPAAARGKGNDRAYMEEESPRLTKADDHDEDDVGKDAHVCVGRLLVAVAVGGPASG